MITINFKNSLEEIPSNLLPDWEGFRTEDDFEMGVITYNGVEVGSVFSQQMNKFGIDAVFVRGVYIIEGYRSLGITIWLIENYFKKINKCVLSRAVGIVPQSFLDTIGAVWDDKEQLFRTTEIVRV